MRIDINHLPVGDGAPLVLIAGPCLIEGTDHALRHAEVISQIAAKHGLPYIFKSSFHKANRTNRDSLTGIDVETAVATLESVSRNVGVHVTTDVHEPEDVALVSFVDLLQIPAFLCRQTRLLQVAALSGIPVNIKKGQFASADTMARAVEKVRTVNGNVMVTERGTFFGYRDLVVDMRNLVKMREGFPVCFDATHACQLPGTFGDRTMALPLARAALAVGVDALFLEVHEEPARAWCDQDVQIPLDELDGFLTRLFNMKL